MFPDVEGGVRFIQRGQCFGIGHEGEAEVMFEIFAADAFQQRTGFGRTLQAHQALAQVGAGINVIRFTFQGGTITFFGLGIFATLKINIAQAVMVVGIIEMMDLGFELPDARPALGTGQLKAGGLGRVTIQKINERRKAPADKNKDRPEPVPLAHGVNEHPQLKPGHQ